MAARTLKGKQCADSALRVLMRAAARSFGGLPRGCLRKKMVRPARFERATFRFGGEYSIQLSYGRIFRL